MTANCGRIDLSGAAGDDDFGIGPLALDPANGLTRLPRGFRRHRAAVDDDEIASSLGQSGTPHRF